MTRKQAQAIYSGLPASMQHALACWIRNAVKPAHRRHEINKAMFERDGSGLNCYLTNPQFNAAMYCMGYQPQIDDDGPSVFFADYTAPHWRSDNRPPVWMPAFRRLAEAITSADARAVWTAPGGPDDLNSR